MDFEERVDPELREALSAAPALDLVDITGARVIQQSMRATRAAEVAPNPDVVRQDHMVPSPDGAPAVRLRHYRPRGQDHPLPCLYWVHGGGHVMGSIDQDDSWCDHVVATIGCTIVSVEWRQAPEHPYPASLNDCHTGLEWTYQQSSALGVDRQRLAVGGASSGGGSAAGLVLLARDRGEIPICLQVLVYPMLDDRNVTLSSQTVTDRRVWCRADNLLAWRRYVGDAVGTASVPVYAAPSRATELAGLPRTFIAVGDLDLFLDEDIDYAQRLMQAGVPTDLFVYAGAYHGSEIFSPKASLSQRIIRDRDEALRRVFWPGTG